MIPYPSARQADAARLVDAALTLSSADLFEPESLSCAAEYLKGQVAAFRTESANQLLDLISQHLKRECDSETAAPTKTMSKQETPEGDCPPTNCSADEVFPLPWSYNCPRGKEAKVCDADSRMVGFFSGADAQTRAAIITRAVNGYEKAMDLLREAADHIDTYDDGMAGWKDEAATILQNA